MGPFWREPPILAKTSPKVKQSLTGSEGQTDAGKDPIPRVLPELDIRSDVGVVIPGLDANKRSNCVTEREVSIECVLRERRGHDHARGEGMVLVVNIIKIDGRGDSGG